MIWDIKEKKWVMILFLRLLEYWGKSQILITIIIIIIIIINIQHIKPTRASAHSTKIPYW